MNTPLAQKIRKALADTDGAAFVDRTKDYAPRSGEDYRPGFVLLVGREVVHVASALPSGYPDRARHMQAYADILTAEGFDVVITYRGIRITAIKVTA